MTTIMIITMIITMIMAMITGIRTITTTRLTAIPRAA